MNLLPSNKGTSWTLCWQAVGEHDVQNHGGHITNAKQEAAHNWTPTYKHLLKPNISSVIVSM